MVNQNQNHTGEKAFKCSGFRNLQEQRIQTEEKPFKCKYNKKGFSCKSFLTFHEFTHTGGKPFKCKFCEKGFTQKGSFERIHTGEKPLKLCTNGFTQKGLLQEHERIHTGDRPFKWKYCAKDFIRKGDLKQHELINFCILSKLKCFGFNTTD